MDLKNKGTIKEFLRYVLVGGIAFVVDFGVFTLLRETLYRGRVDVAAITVSTAAGFLVGLAVNYLLSMLIVFRKESQQKQGKTLKAVLIFAAVGVVGFGLTELLQWIGESFVLKTPVGKLFGDLGKYAVKLFVSGVVMVWNYVGRKIFVFKGE